MQHNLNIIGRILGHYSKSIMGNFKNIIGSSLVIITSLDYKLQPVVCSVRCLVFITFRAAILVYTHYY